MTWARVFTHLGKDCYHARVIRTQVSLTERQMADLRALARRRGVSIASVVRDAVDAELRRDARADRVRRAREVFGAFRSGRRDLGRRHDAHLEEAFADGGGGSGKDVSA